MNPQSFGFTPREIVSELDRYIVGQDRAKRAVAIALRNRWRRQQVPADIRDEIMPKNIIMIGPTGVGKTEVARRLAKLAGAPFVKVEASKFTEVGYVGRDVESIIRDLVELAVQMVRAEHIERIEARAEEHAEDRLIELILAQRDEIENATPATPEATNAAPHMPGQMPQMFGPFVIPAMGGAPGFSGQIPHPQKSRSFSEEDIAEVKKQLRAGELDEETVELEVNDNSNPFMSVIGVSGMEGLESQLKDVFNQMPGMKGRTKPRKVKVPEARKLLQDEEAQKLIDLDGVQREAVERTEQAGIVFLDEIDKVAGRQSSHGGPDVSREGVQRDLLPIVEGSSVSTKYGAVRTDHILFIAAGAFHVAKVSDLIPELQGRFPIRVELDSLGKKELVRILTEPKNALTRQYEALLKTEGVSLTFSDDAVEAIAEYATESNQRAENIGARRLHTMMEALLEEMSYSASDSGESTLKVDSAYVKDKLGAVLHNEDMARYIL